MREDLKDDKRFLPTRAESKASGWDVRAAMPDKNPLIIKPFQHIKIPLGFRSFCPDGWWYELKPRSSSFTKKNLHALYGTIDESYEGELLLACQYIPEVDLVWHFHAAQMNLFTETDSLPINPPPLTINFGDAIGQIIPVERKEITVIEWSNNEYDAACKHRAGERGDKGFGSTDEK